MVIISDMVAAMTTIYGLSVSYASRAALINKADGRGKSGFKFDLSKILNAVRLSGKQPVCAGSG
jgi:hypothetical protein